MSKRSKGKPQTQDRIASIMTDMPVPDKKKIDSNRKKMRPITSDTNRPLTQNRGKRRQIPVRFLISKYR